ncbi:transport permease protein [Catellatospora sp. TT07R-123]|uniref:ABC transporter permease n=1 Tax=Catellatospora sp. TT07R-123 TaxID=2733863 RepID=UPI001B048B15|nr:ABC transporter permease [Catellatospora sp. TT07R-123]GHJ48917.1 transport permease protein [Catellatospora sp. TT07R-123]
MTTLSLPSSGRLGLARGAVELRQFFRSKAAVGFSLAFPALLLVLLGSIFKGSGDHPESSVAQVFSASMIAYGIVSTAFISIGTGIATDREDGTLKRLRGTPMTALAYFTGKLIVVAVTTLAEVALLLTVGVLAFDMELPDGAGRWLTFAWVLGLSIVSSTALGVAASALVRSSRSAGVILNVPVVALQFLSGIFVHPISSLPHWMVTVASLFPVKWMAQGFRSVFLPDALAAQELAGSWEHGRIALVLGAWCVIGLALCLTTFRWTAEDR